MVYDRRPLLTTAADKVAVREVVRDNVGPDHVVGLLEVADDPRQINWEALPREFVAKVNHGSGGVVVVTSDAAADARLPERVGHSTSWRCYRVRPESLVVPHLIALLKSWLELDYAWVPGRATIEWCYEDIPRRVLVEELLRDAKGAEPAEYRLFVINGQVAFIQAEIDPFGERATAVMSRVWEALPVRMFDPPPANVPGRPANLRLMVDVAESLGRQMVDFVRVDVYDLLDRVVVGELTHYPMGGRSPVSRRHYARLWGRNWVTPY